MTNDMDVYDSAKNNCDKHYIHDGYQVITMNFDKALMYGTIKELTKWELDNLICIIITPKYPWYPSSINNEL